MASTALLFLDTNIFLHFKPISDIDWARMLRESGISAGGAKIVIPRVTVNELDTQKVENRSETLRERAQRALVLIDSWHEAADRGTPTLIRGQFPIVVDMRTPVVDYEHYQLRRAIKDDELIAALLTEREQATEAPTLVLVTGDTGPRLVARTHKLAVIRPSDSDRLSSERDALAKELVETRRELAQYKQKEPQLTLRFVHNDGQEPENRLVMVVPEMAPEPADAWEAAMARAAAAIPPILPQEASARTDDHVDPSSAASKKRRLGIDFRELVRGDPTESLASTISSEEYERYARQRDAIIAQYRLNLREAWLAWNVRRRSVLVRLRIENQATTPAEHVTVTLNFPDRVGAEVPNDFELEYLSPPPGDQPPIPAVPAGPAPPRSMLLVAMEGSAPRVWEHAPILPSLHQLHAGSYGLTLKRENGVTGRQTIPKLRSTDPADLDVFRIWFPVDATPKGFQITYTITADNLVVPATGELHVQVRGAP